MLAPCRRHGWHQCGTVLSLCREECLNIHQYTCWINKHRINKSQNQVHLSVWGQHTRVHLLASALCFSLLVYKIETILVSTSKAVLELNHCTCARCVHLCVCMSMWVHTHTPCVWVSREAAETEKTQNTWHMSALRKITEFHLAFTWHGLQRWPKLWRHLKNLANFKNHDGNQCLEQASVSPVISHSLPFHSTYH
jgi:hypothetical protein